MLQKSISQHGLESFTAFVFEEVQYPSSITSDAAKSAHRLFIEQSYIIKFPRTRLYNSINAKK